MQKHLHTITLFYKTKGKKILKRDFTLIISDDKDETIFFFGQKKTWV